MAIVLLAFGVLQLLMQSGRILTRLEELEHRVDELQEMPGTVADRPTGLPPNTLGPDFELPDLDGTFHRFSALYAERPVLLIFFDVQSPACLAMLPDLAHVSEARSAEQPHLVVVTSGPPDRVQELFQIHQVQGIVLLQETDELFRLYRVETIPSAGLFSSEGRIVIEYVTGGDACLTLCEAKTASLADQAVAEAVAKSGTGPTGPVRQAPEREPPELVPGDPAPTFTLPTVDGGTISLGDYSGKRVLLVFTDPICVPCLEILPDLEALHRSESLPVLLISRRDEALNAEMIEQHALSTPVALQSGYDVLDRYGPRLIPAACLVDTDGSLASTLQFGPNGVRRLIEMERVPA